MNVKLLLLLFVIEILVISNGSKQSHRAVIDDITNIKDFKKVLRTKTNVLVNFVSSISQAQNVIKVFRDAAEEIRGQGTMLLIDCSVDSKKLCKKLKVYPEPYILKHYNNGDFNKDYDRKLTVASMKNFMRDPTGDIPWEEDVGASDVYHVLNAQALGKFIKKESKPIMVMFYAPWCGFCKQLKPDYSAAATELKGHSVLAAIDVNRPENSVIRTQYNITGFPTLLYYENGKLKYHYEGENNKQGIINFMKNPQESPVKVKEPEWSDKDNDIVHLTSTNFEPILKEEASALVMFYAPWCGHCQRMKPEYEKAATQLKNKNIPGMLAALDATKETAVASQFKVTGYPSVKYFAYGELKFDVNVREADKIVNFMKDPKEPPPPPEPEPHWSEQASEVVHLTEENFKPFLKKKKHVLVMFYAPWCGHCKKAKPEFTAAAEHFRDDTRVQFAAVDCTQIPAVCQAYDVKGYPTFKYFQYLKTNKPYNGGRLSQDFIRFMSNPDHHGPDQGSIKTEDFGWSEIEGHEHIVFLESNNIKDVIKSKKQLFIFFYAPWCGYCKKMKRAYAELASEIEQDQNLSGVEIAAIDCSQYQDVNRQFNITGYPTCRLYVDGKEVVEYDGPKTAKDMKKFLKTHVPSHDEL